MALLAMGGKTVKLAPFTVLPRKRAIRGEFNICALDRTVSSVRAGENHPIYRSTCRAWNRGSQN
jgi:hypothetical protein